MRMLRLINIISGKSIDKNTVCRIRLKTERDSKKNFVLNLKLGACSIYMKLYSKELRIESL